MTIVRHLLLASVLVALAAPARAQVAKHLVNVEAKQHLERSRRAFDEGRYADAISELKGAYAIDPRPDFLYALGQAERKRGDCRAAIRYYQAYVDTGPSAQQTVAVSIQIDRCKQSLATAPPEAPAAPAPSVVAPSAPSAPAVPAPSVLPAEPATTTLPSARSSALARATPASAPRSTPVYKRWWLWTTVVGAVAVGVGVGVGVGVFLPPRSSFQSTLPDLVIHSSALVRF